MRRIIIVGASSGIGEQLARICIEQGWRVGLAARRTERLSKLKELAPDRVTIETIDVTNSRAGEQLSGLIEQVGGMDIYMNCAGVGWQNRALDIDKEMQTIGVNVEGFVRMVDTAFGWFRANGGGHIAVISSVAGTRGLGTAASYSATKRFESSYIDALAQLARMEHLGITFTDIRPGFVATDILNSSLHYPMLMQPDRVAAKIFRAVRRHRRVAVIDWRYGVLVVLWRMIPRCVWERVSVKN